MWTTMLETCWPFLVILVVLAVVVWFNSRHNRDAARKGQNPRSLNLRFGRNAFRKDPEMPYTEDRKINRYWKP